MQITSFTWCAKFHSVVEKNENNQQISKGQPHCLEDSQESFRSRSTCQDQKLFRSSMHSLHVAARRYSDRNVMSQKAYDESRVCDNCPKKDNLHMCDKDSLAPALHPTSPELDVPAPCQTSRFSHISLHMWTLTLLKESPHRKLFEDKKAVNLL